MTLMEFVPESGCVNYKFFSFFEGKKSLYFVLYVQVFIVITKLARAAQPIDITPTPGPCSMIPRHFLSRSSGSFRHL